MNEKISVIIPVYNVDSWIRRCIESVIQQTYSDLQIILVDDGSSDRSGLICDEYCKLDSRIVTIHTNNQGSVRARKNGLKVATGEFIGFVDGDDCIAPQMYEHLMNAIYSSGADIVHCGYFEYTENEKVKEITCFSSGNYDLSTEIEKREFINKFFFQSSEYNEITPSIWSKLFRAEIIKKTFGFIPDSQQIGEDVLCLIYSVMEAHSICLLKEPLYYYLNRNDSLSHLLDRQYIINLTKLLTEVIKIGEKEKQERGGCIEYFDYIYKITNLIYQRTEPDFITYFLPNVSLFFNKKVSIYGAGKVGADYYKQLRWYKSICVEKVYDKEFCTIVFKYCEVNDPQEIYLDDADIILIAIKSRKIADSIRKDLESVGIISNRIMWIPCRIAGKSELI